MNLLFKSKALLAISVILATGAVLRLTRPLQDLSTSEYPFWDQNPLRTKLEAAVTEKSKPDFLLLGSSLAMNSNYEADCKLENRAAVSGGNYYRHSDAKLLSSLIGAAVGTTVEGKNISCPACMVADADSILEMLNSHKALPQFVVYCIAPRDFMDNVVGEHMYNSFAITPQDYLREAFSRSFVPAVDKLYGEVSHLYGVRHDYQTMSTILSRSVLKCALESTATKSKPHRNCKSEFNHLFIAHDLDQQLPKRRMQHQADDYIKRYRPFYQSKFDQQWQHMTAVSDLCKQNGTRLYLVNMPVSEQNEALMTPELRAEYKERLDSFCRENRVSLIDIPTEEKFVDADFRDTVHLRAQASVEAFKLVAEAVGEQELAAHQAFAAKPSAVPH